MLFISDEESGLLEYNTVDTTTRWVKKWGKEDDGFSRLTSVAFDRDNYLYAIDHNKERILIFSPQKSLYSNLDLEITSVDTGKFPVIACYVNIRKRDGSPVYGLTKDNFTVMEDSARMSGLYINYLKDQAASVSIVLCVDRSLAAKGWHNELSWSADFILKNMRKNDVVKVSNFNSDVWSSHDFDWSRRRALREIRKRAYRKGKKIGKALYNALSDVLRKQDRRAVVMLTDGSVGDDSFSQYSFRHIIHYAQSHFIPIYIIYFKEKNPVLQQIARETGGAFIKAAAVDSMRRVYDTIKKSEEHRYVIVYSTLKTKSFKGWWSDVTIKVDMKGQQGLEWGGYFVPE
jgi:VWFA-related protein